MRIDRGTKSIGHVQPNRRKPSWKSVGQSGRLMLVWLKCPPSSTTGIWPGHLKPLLNMLMTGLPRNEVLTVSMPTHIVVGFSRILLNEVEADQVMSLARDKGRYLIPAEINLLLEKDLSKTIQSQELLNMQKTWIDFCKEKNLDQQTSMTNVFSLEMWWDYVAKHYKEPLPVASPWDN